MVTFCNFLICIWNELRIEVHDNIVKTLGTGDWGGDEHELGHEILLWRNVWVEEFGRYGLVASRSMILLSWITVMS